MSKSTAIIQARSGSTRLPGKMLADLNGVPALAYMIKRVQQARMIDEIWIATTNKESDDAIVELAELQGVRCFRGDENDVLKRFYDTAIGSAAKTIVRLTGDCPMVDPTVIDQSVAIFYSDAGEYVSNVIERTFPDGLDVEVFSFDTLEKTHNDCQDTRLREHVTPYMKTGVYPNQPSGKFSVAHVKSDADFSHLRWTLDEQEDLDFFRRILSFLPDDFHWLDAVGVLSKHPELLCWNRQKKWRIGALADLRTTSTVSERNNPFGESNKFFQRASTVIPLASQTFSKSYQQVVLGAAPLFIDRAKGCHVIDLDGNEYIDYIMGLLPVVLGHCDPDVDAAIFRQMEKGITFSLPSPLETELSELLVDLIPCAEMVRFGKNGSDATTAAIRLARAVTGRDRVAVAGYHGWHDWYIGTTTRYLGVPDAVRKLSATFDYNDANTLETLLSSDKEGFAAVILEPAGATPPEPGFLERVKELTHQHGALLVFDEVISGFRINLGGAQKEYDVIPDLAAFGKSMANGMPISALTGSRKYMKQIENIFFSGTFAGEALSLAASLATIEKLERENGIARTHEVGKRLKTGMNATFEENGFSELLSMVGSDWWPRLKLTRLPVETNLFKSLMRQELNAAGLLIGGGLNLSLAHDSERVLQTTQSRLDHALKKLKTHLDSSDPYRCLKGEMIKPTFAIR